MSEPKNLTKFEEYADKALQLAQEFQEEVEQLVEQMKEDVDNMDQDDLDNAFDSCCFGEALGFILEDLSTEHLSK